MPRDGTAATPTSTTGFVCLKCGITTRVIDCRHSRRAFRRRRECIGCGYRFTTIEEYEEMKGAGRAYRKPKITPELADPAAAHRARWEREHPGHG